MNRRVYIKSIAVLTLLGAGSISFFKWLNVSFDVKDLARKRDVLAELVDLVIPRTDTPGARDAGVHDYIINVITNCNSPREQSKFISGIQSLEDYALTLYHKEFLKCGKADQLNVLEYFSKDWDYSNKYLNKISKKIFGLPFYVKLRNLTIEGYCMSELGATQGLRYDYIPGDFFSCIPLHPNQKSWATK